MCVRKRGAARRLSVRSSPKAAGLLRRHVIRLTSIRSQSFLSLEPEEGIHEHDHGGRVQEAQEGSCGAFAEAQEFSAISVPTSKVKHVVAASKVGNMMVPNQPMYRRFSVLVIHSQKRAQRVAFERFSRIAVIKI